MVGFLGALAGGALKGWGEGQLANIKATREEKLRKLELDRAERLQIGQQQFESRENALNRQSTEKLTAAQLDMNRRLAELQEAGATTRQSMQIGAQKEINAADIASREKISRDSLDVQERLAKMQDDTTREIEGNRIDAQADLNIEKIVTKDGKTVWVAPGGRVIDTPIDPNTGKEIDPAITDGDTPEMKNYKFLVSVGVPETSARQVFTTKNADPTIIRTSLIETFVKAQTTFGNADANTIKQAEDWADGVLSRMPGFGGATVPAASTEAATIKPPPGTSKEQIIQEAKRALQNPRADRAAIRKALQDNDIDPALAGL